MNAVKSVSAALGMLAATTASAADYLTEVASPVYETTGTATEIAQHAQRCISQRLGSGVAGGELIISSDLPGGVIVARNALEYTDGLMNWQVRSRFTFEAREGRFRMQQMNLERFNRQWGGIGKWAGSGWKKAEAAFAGSAERVAQCVMTQKPQEDW